MITVFIALAVNAAEACLVSYFFASPAGAPSPLTAAAQLAAALATALATTIIAVKKGSVLAVELPAVASESAYMKAVDDVGALPFKLFLIFVGIGIIGAAAGTAASVAVLGADPFKMLVLAFLNLSFLCVLGSYLYVILDRTVLRHLLSFKISRFPAALR